TLTPIALAVFTIGFLMLVAWGYGKTTVYTITDRRVVIRSGVAFQVTFNIPFATIRGADKCRLRDGTGNISLELDGSAHIAYLHIWPNARPWHLSRVQPMLRHIRQPDAVAGLLGDALRAYHAVSRVPAPAAKKPNEEKVDVRLVSVERAQRPAVEAAE
ncbi:MAG: PH domain-containing protein, partial [Alphaproteobacteria bacterium]|nr:PH domain-containing protein [Alphaproteobacteria bacterium]